jgi:hypothetical protein
MIFLMRRPARGRETFIALRAARQGYRIASDIANPHLDLPEYQPTVRSPEEVLQESRYVEYESQLPLMPKIVYVDGLSRGNLWALIFGLLIPLVFVAILVNLLR